MGDRPQDCEFKASLSYIPRLLSEGVSDRVFDQCYEKSLVQGGTGKKRRKGRREIVGGRRRKKTKEMMRDGKDEEGGSKITHLRLSLREAGREEKNLNPKKAM